MISTLKHYESDSETALRLLLAVTLIAVAGKLGSSEWNTAASIVGALAQSAPR